MYLIYITAYLSLHRAVTRQFASAYEKRGENDNHVIGIGVINTGVKRAVLSVERPSCL